MNKHNNEYFGLICPNCGCIEWYKGPEGSGSQMLKCVWCSKIYCYSPIEITEVEDENNSF